MLKPSATKTNAQATSAAMLADFIARGGSITVAPVAVASGLRKTRYIRRVTKIKQDNA